MADFNFIYFLGFTCSGKTSFSSFSLDVIKEKLIDLDYLIEIVFLMKINDFLVYKSNEIHFRFLENSISSLSISFKNSVGSGSIINYRLMYSILCRYKCIVFINRNKNLDKNRGIFKSTCPIKCFNERIRFFYLFSNLTVLNE
ncbi:hypothetical protein ACWNYH_00825 [Candidatus Vidania fulgoroideorum]